MEIKRTQEEQIKNFKASTFEEILEFNPQVGEKFTIEYIDCCPWTGGLGIETATAYVEDIKFQDNKFNFCFIFTGMYGLDCYYPFENVKIIERLN